MEDDIQPQFTELKNIDMDYLGKVNVEILQTFHSKYRYFIAPGLRAFFHYLINVRLHARTLLQEWGWGPKEKFVSRGWGRVGVDPTPNFENFTVN